MSDNTIEEIKSRLDLVDIVKEYVELEKVGSNLRALCPFHSEKTPSFFVSPTRQSWRCFGGCNEGGDIFDFIMKVEGVEFRDALSILAKKAGVELKKINKEEVTKKERFYEMYRLATVFFEKQLESSKRGKKAKAYLLERKITEESIRKWKLGYSPDSWQALSEFLISKGFKRKEIVESGLALEKKNHSYDRFRGRIMFPIANNSSRTIAFGGRIFGKDKDTAKYMNSPQTLLYDKSKVLYGLDKAKVEIRRQDFCILVEGYTDVIMSHQAGFENVISTSGTALTKKQLNILSRYTKNIFTCFDMDDAGESATKKAISMAKKLDFDVRVIILPEGKDPADLISDDKKKWQEAIKNSEEVVEFYFKRAFKGRNLKSPKDKKKIAKELLPVIKNISDKIEQSHWVKELSDKLDVDKEILMSRITEVRKKNSKNKKPARKPKRAKIKKRKEILEEKILSLLAKNKKRASLVKDPGIFSPEGAKIIKALQSKKKEEKEVKEKIDYFALKPENEIENSEEEIKRCIKEIKKERAKEKFRKIQKEIKKAEKEKDKKSLKKLTEEAYRISKKIQSYNNHA